MVQKNDAATPTVTDEGINKAYDELIEAAGNIFQPKPFLASGKATRKLVKFMNAAYDGGQKPVMIRGLPGGGKTEWIKSWAASRNFHVEPLNLAEMDPTDLQGHLTIVSEPDRVITDPETGKDIVVPGETYTKYTKPEYARNIDRALANGYTGAILFLDEFSNAAPSMKAASLTLVQNKRINNLILPNELMVVGAMNEVADAEDGYTLGAPSANRMFHVPFATDFDDWCEGMLVAFNQRELSPEEREQRMMFVRFLSAENTNWYSKPKSDEAAGAAWPSPRSWDNAASVCALLLDDKNAHLDALTYAVGKDAAASYWRWRDGLRLPEYAVVMAHPENQPWDEFKADEIYYILQNINARVSGENLRASSNVYMTALEAGVSEVTSALVDELCSIAAALSKKGQVDRTQVFDLLKALSPYSAAAGV